jgi:hypothetical protein
MRIRTMLAASLLAATAALAGAGTAAADDDGFKVVSIDDPDVLKCSTVPVIPIAVSLLTPPSSPPPELPAECSGGQ